MGGFLDKPKTDKFYEAGEGNGLRYAVASMQGWREEMEDAHMAKCAGLTDDERLRDWSYFAVFDGHSGARVAMHCASYLLDAIVAQKEFSEDVIKGIRQGFLEFDDKMRSLPEMSSGEDKSGTTAVCAFVSPKEVFIANCGDSRAVLYRNGRPVFSTRDHKPGLRSERDRIENAGGTVLTQRVNGNLAVSRALGDFEYKNVKGRGPCEQLVSPEPEIFVEERDHRVDEFLVLACDGIWDVMSNEDLCAFVRNRLQVTEDLREVTSQVIDTCLYKRSRDNMSIVLVLFPGAPRPNPEAIQAERDLDALLERRIKEIVEENKDIEFSQLFSKLDFEIVDVPPGGGLHSKQGLIRQIYEKLFPDRTDADFQSSDYYEVR